MYKKPYTFNVYNWHLEMGVCSETITTIYTMSMPVTSRSFLPHSLSMIIIILFCDNNEKILVPPHFTTNTLEAVH